MPVIVKVAVGDPPGPECLQPRLVRNLREFAAAVVAVASIAKEHLLVLRAHLGELCQRSNSEIVGSLVLGRSGLDKDNFLFQYFRAVRPRVMLIVGAHPHVGVHIDDKQIEPAVVVQVEQLLCR